MLLVNIWISEILVYSTMVTKALSLLQTTKQSEVKPCEVFQQYLSEEYLSDLSLESRKHGESTSAGGVHVLGTHVSLYKSGRYTNRGRQLVTNSP